MKRSLVVVAIVFICAGACAGAKQTQPTTTGTMIKWMEMDHTVLYRVTSNAIDYDYLIERDDVSTGLFDRNNDPLHLLKPQDEFTFRLDSSKHRIIVLWDRNGKRHETRYKIWGMKPRGDESVIIIK